MDTINEALSHRELQRPLKAQARGVDVREAAPRAERARRHVLTRSSCRKDATIGQRLHETVQFSGSVLLGQAFLLR